MAEEEAAAAGGKDEKESSLCIVVGFSSCCSFASAIYEVKIKIGREGVIVVGGGKEKVTPLAKLFDSVTYGRSISDLVGDALGSEVYLFASQYNLETDAYSTLLPMMFNTKTKETCMLPRSVAPKVFPTAIAVKQKEQIFVVSNIRADESQPIESLHTNSPLWEVLREAPFHFGKLVANISGYAVVKDYILFSLGYGKKVEFYAYKMNSVPDVWVPVSTMQNVQYYAFNMKAAVVENLIYTYLIPDDIQDDDVVTYEFGFRDGCNSLFLGPPVRLQGVKIAHNPEGWNYRTSHCSIAQIGDRILCLVLTSHNYHHLDIQPVCITMIRLCDHPNVETLNSTILNLDIEGISRANILFCLVPDDEEGKSQASGAGLEEGGIVNDLEKLKLDE